MEASSFSPFDQLPHEMVDQIIQFSNVENLASIRATDNRLEKLAIHWFKDANRNITAGIPALKAVIKKEEDSKNPILLFKRLVNQLHDEAKRLNCNTECPLGVNLTEKMKWECNHYQTLVSDVNKKTQELKKKDLATFVKAVAEEMNLKLEDIPFSIDDPEKVWAYLKEQKPNVTKLDLSNQEIYFLPQEIGQLTSLKTLNLKNNKIINFPSEIKKLTQLTDLNLSNNQFQKVPSEITELTELEKLDIAFNDISELPKEIILLKKLKNLNVNGNKIKTWPQPEVLKSISMVLIGQQRS